MTRATRAALFAALPLLLVVLVCGFSAETADLSGVPILVTAAPAYDALAALHGGERFPQGAQLLMVREGKAEPLINDFAATADANVSFDAAKVLFSGKKTAADRWQIWELTLADHSVHPVTTGAGDAVRPFYLPGGRLVFARRQAQGFQLIAADLDGKNELPLSYMTASAVPTDVLADGRILFESGFPLGEGSTPELYLVYSDGSGVESYRCDHSAAHPGSPATGPGRWGGRWGGHQLASGDVVFTHGASLARFTSPLAHEESIAAPRGEYADGLAETLSGDWLLSSRTSAAMPFVLKAWNPPATAMTTVLARAGENLVEPVLLAPRTRPKQHPSGLHDWNYAILLALDARLSREGNLKTTPAQVRLEKMDPSGRAVAMGTSPVAPDGSFFVKAPADQPIRFVLLDQKGAAVRREHGWFWIRSGEQRFCVGCHTGPERAPENNVPEVLLRSTTPTDLTGAPSSSTADSAQKGGR
jgi:hypothetical protein